MEKLNLNKKLMLNAILTILHQDDEHLEKTVLLHLCLHFVILNSLLEHNWLVKKYELIKSRNYSSQPF